MNKRALLVIAVTVVSCGREIETEAPVALQRGDPAQASVNPAPSIRVWRAVSDEDLIAGSVVEAPAPMRFQTTLTTPLLTSDPTLAAQLSVDPVTGSTPGWIISAAMVTAGVKAGEFVVAGSQPTVAQGLDMFLERYSAAGVLLWRRTITGNGGADDYAHAVAVSSTGDAIYLGGGISLAPTGERDAFLRKYDANGNEQWTRTTDGTLTDNDELNAIALDEAGGGVIVGGVLRSIGRYNDAWGARYTTSGALAWSFTFNGAGNQQDGVHAVTVDPSTGSAAFAGYSTPVPEPTLSRWVAWGRLITRSGQTIWMDNFPRSNGGTSLVRSVSWSQGIAVAAISYNDPSELGGAVARYTEQNNAIDVWEFTSITPRAIAIGPSKRMYVAGDMNVASGKRFFVGRINSSGALAWSTTANEPIGAAYGLAVNSTSLVGAGLVYQGSSYYPYYLRFSPLP